ncbi:MAG: YaeQ family protein, partial [Arcobacteraceae bacterium]|nr:YaeQ family protein [Arcobacteraceae bacterium]
KGISQDDEPDLWQKSLSGDIEMWIDFASVNLLPKVSCFD